MTHSLLSVAFRTIVRRRARLVAVGFWISVSGGATQPLPAQGQATPTLAAHFSSWVNDPARPLPVSPQEDAAGPSRSGKSDRYFVLPPCPVNQYTSGEIIAVPKDRSPILNATLKKGTAPTGTALFPNGCLVVVDPTQLDVGTYRFAVETADQAGNTMTHALTVKLKPSGKEDTDAMYAVRQSKALDQYVRGDVLAVSQDRDGAIVRSEFVKGQLPPGSALTDDGRVVVDDPAQLQAGQYAAWIATEDKEGGTTLFIITLVL